MVIWKSWKQKLFFGEYDNSQISVILPVWKFENHEEKLFFGEYDNSQISVILPVW